MRYALRALLRSPGFTAVAVLSLALGIGANTAIFSLIETLILRTLPVRAPGQLVEILNLYPGDPPANAFSLAAFQHYRDRNHVFSDVTGVFNSSFTVRPQGLDSETRPAACVIGNFFPMLGLTPALGRLIAPADDRPGDPASVAVLSWRFWKSRFNLDRNILGRRIDVDNVPLTVIGVTPPEFLGLQPIGTQPDLWIPMAAESLIHHPSRVGLGGLSIVARLKTGASLQQARAEMTVLHRFTVEERTANSKNPVLKQLKVDVEPAGAGLSNGLRDRFARPLWLLMAVVGLLLLIACTNVASMLLARGAARRREMAVRVALGAGPFRLMRQVWTESLLLAGAGALCGIAISGVLAGVLVRTLASGRRIVGLPPHFEIPVRMDVHVLLFTAAAGILVGLLFGLVPAFRAFATAPASALHDFGNAAETRSRRLFGKALVVLQVALSLVLLSAAALFLRHLHNLHQMDLGFRRDHILLVTLDPSRSGYTPERQSLAYREFLDRLQSIPGVRSATTVSAIPISGAGASRLVDVEGHPEKPENRRYLSLNWVAPRYFETFGTPLLAGRDFTFEDGASRVAIVNQALARYYFPDGAAAPIGKHITLDGDRDPYEIIGLVGDARYFEVRETPLRTVYFNTFQSARPSSHFALRTSNDPAAIAPEVRRTVRATLPNVPVTDVTTFADVIDASLIAERLVAMLSTAFGALGVLLAATGLYGLLAYTVARRTNEIGIRMALGANRTQVTRMVLSDALRTVAAGLLFGIPMILAVRRFAAAILPDMRVSVAQPIVIAVIAILAIAAVAAYVPARRAAQVDPLQALRQD